MVKLFIAIHWMVLQATVATVLYILSAKMPFGGEILAKSHLAKLGK